MCGALPFVGLKEAWSVDIKVACVGDSITEGAGLSNTRVDPYPAKLDQLLGLGYFVRNFGLGGRTLLKKGDFPYTNEGIYNQSLSWEPNIVIIMLGTNDAKPQNWRFGDEFVADYEELIASYQNLSTNPRILLASPCPVYAAGAFDISPTVVAEEIAPAVVELASRLELDLIHYHQRMAGFPEWLPDTVHPNTQGTAVMAALAFEALMKPDPNLPTPVLNSVPVSPSISSLPIELNWPVANADYVVQETFVLEGEATKWNVIARPMSHDGERLNIKPVVQRPGVFHRLWKP